MSDASAQGEQDATIIPFPLHRVSSPAGAENTSKGAVVQELPVFTENPEISAELAGVTSSKAQSRAHNVSLHALAGRDQSRYEVEAKLHQRGLLPDVIEAEVEHLVAAGLINDDALALDLVDRYANRQGMAKPVVAQKLRLRHLAQESVVAALASLDGDTEMSKLDDLAKDRLRKMGDLSPAVTKRRLAAFLQRKGFSSSEIYSTLDRILGSP
jgi:regulatory protein